MKGYCYASNKTMANELNVGTKTISNSISKLNKNKMIIIKYVDSNRRIYLNPEIVEQENAKVREKDFQETMEINYQQKRINNYKRKINNNIGPVISKDIDGVELWDGKRCENTLASPEEQQQMEQMINEITQMKGE